jgi:hypothetical protein
LDLEDAPEDALEDAPEGSLEDALEDAPEDALEDASEDALEDASEDLALQRMLDKLLLGDLPVSVLVNCTHHLLDAVVHLLLVHLLRRHVKKAGEEMVTMMP